MKIKRIIKKVKRKYNVDLDVKINNQNIVINGEMDNYLELVDVGYMFVNKRMRVVNNIKLKGYQLNNDATVLDDTSLDQKEVDVLIIGGGIIGCTILRELSKYQLRILLIEKEADVACGASGANDGMIHVGIDLKKNSVKAKYCLKGNLMYDDLSKELDFSFIRCSQYLVEGSRFDRLLSLYLLYKAITLKIPFVKRIRKKEIIKLEPSTKSFAKGAIKLGLGGIISPYQATIAFAENALMNGAEIALETKALKIICDNQRIREVKTNRGTIIPKIVINAAGIYADKIAELAKDQTFSIHSRKGTDIIFDKRIKYLVNTIISRYPNKRLKTSRTKGGGIISTVDGNILIGPDANEVYDREDTSTSIESIDRVFNKHSQVIKELKKSDIISYFSGLRACTYEEDFIIEQSKNVHNLIHVAGIQSPGLTAAPAIALDVSKMVLNHFCNITKKELFNPYRKGIKKINQLKDEERKQLILKNPDYGKIICRCEEISLGEIKDAIHSILPAKSIDAIKRRVRPGMGRCQGGFCMPLVLKILSDELQEDLISINKKGKDTNIGLYHIKDIRFKEGVD